MDDGGGVGNAEVEKPFKCSVCSARFTNEDHLQVHRRRHEMSLSFTKNGPINLGQEGFVDETPTPSRFIRNCEEVGLFQDLNPFDEQFSKAASGTPTSENNFGFQFSQTKAANPDDTLNTPQVFGYVPTTTATFSSITSLSTSNVRVVGSSSLKETDKNVIPEAQSESSVDSTGSMSPSRVIKGPEINLSKEPSVSRVGIDDEVTISIDEPIYESVTNFSEEDNVIEIPCIPNVISNSSRADQDLLNTKKQKSNLRLTIESTPHSISRPNEIIQTYSAGVYSKHPESIEKKSELLERNRAAASRSRQRRKQWISALEGKYDDLQSDYVKLQSELLKLRAENNLLKLELTKHANCNVTQSQSPIIRSKPTILRQTSQTPAAVIVTHTPDSPIKHFNESPLINTVRIIQAPPQPRPQPKEPVKRGRPRKGHEKRVSVVQDIPVQKNTEPLKVQILPLYSVQKSNNSQKVFILKS